MKHTIGLCSSLAGLVILSSSLNAQTQIYVAFNGNDSNPGTITSPKRTFQAAHDAALFGGEIIALTNGDFGTINITKAITILSAPGVIALVNVPSATTGINVSASAGFSVNLRGISIEGSANNGTGIFLNGGAVTLQDCIIRNLNTGILVSGGVFTVITALSGRTKCRSASKQMLLLSRRI